MESEKAILNEQNIKEIRELADNVRQKMAREVNAEYKGAYDVELGFKNNKLLKENLTSSKQLIASVLQLSLSI